VFTDHTYSVALTNINNNGHYSTIASCHLIRHHPQWYRISWFDTH
jgi:hypothetical protein